MDEQLRFYEQEGGKISYGDLQPIVFENSDHMPPSTPQNILQNSQKQFTFEGKFYGYLIRSLRCDLSKPVKPFKKGW